MYEGNTEGSERRVCQRCRPRLCDRSVVRRWILVVEQHRNLKRRARTCIRFARYLVTVLPPERLRLRIYKVDGREPDPQVMALTRSISIRPAFKMKRTAYHLYVNSRPLVRCFNAWRELLDNFPVEYLGSYFAGRFDGDGSFGTTPRIAYTTREEAEIDVRLLTRAGVLRTSTLYYKKANEHCIYIHKASWEQFRELIGPFSLKADRRFTL